MQYSLLFDAERCIGCHACEVACKQENNVPAGPKWIRVIRKGPWETSNGLKMTYILERCRHCGRPPCIVVCPVNAIMKQDNGIVCIDRERCIGCKNCIEACPFKAPQFIEEEKIVEMCTLCEHRLQRGLNPSCVENCMTKAIQFGDINSLSQILTQKRSILK